jgi:hypothetical protein
MMRFFASYSVEEARRAVPPGAPRSPSFEGSISSLPMASLKHIARAAQIAAQDGSIARRIDTLIGQNDPRSLGRYLEKLGEEGKLGRDWSPEDFVSARGIKRTKSRAGRRTARRRLETGADILRRRAIVVSRRIARKLLAVDDLALLARFDFATSITEEPHAAHRPAEALENLEEMIAALPHVKPVDPRTWTKLSELVPLREAASAALRGAQPSAR